MEIDNVFLMVLVSFAGWVFSVIVSGCLAYVRKSKENLEKNASLVDAINEINTHRIVEPEPMLALDPRSGTTEEFIAWLDSELYPKPEPDPYNEISYLQGLGIRGNKTPTAVISYPHGARVYGERLKNAFTQYYGSGGNRSYPMILDSGVTVTPIDVNAMSFDLDKAKLEFEGLKLSNQKLQEDLQSLLQKARMI